MPSFEPFVRLIGSRVIGELALIRKKTKTAKKRANAMTSWFERRNDQTESSLGLVSNDYKIIIVVHHPQGYDDDIPMITLEQVKL